MEDDEKTIIKITVDNNNIEYDVEGDLTTSLVAILQTFCDVVNDEIDVNSRSKILFNAYNLLQEKIKLDESEE